MAGVVPGLATVLVGEDPASRLCVDSKHRDCAEVGIRSVRVQLHGDATQAEILNVIDELNACQDNDVSWFDWANVDHDLLDFTQRLIRLRREHPVLRRRRFLTGAEAHEVGWFTPSGTAMTDSDWDDTQARAIAVYLDGQDDPDRAADGTPLLDDDLFICANAWWEPLDFTIPTQDPDTSWTVLVDTANPSVGRTSGSSGPSPQLSNGDRITVVGRSIAVVLGTR